MIGGSDYFFKVEGPLLAPPANGTMRACGFFEGVDALVRGHGGNLYDVIERHGIDRDEIRDRDYAVPCSSAAAILDYCSVAYDDRLFGLRLGKCLDSDVYGAITAFARLAPDMRTAIDILLEYLPIIYCPGAEAELVETGEVAEFRWRASTNFAVEEQANYLGQSQIVQFLQGLIGREFRPGAIHLASAPSRHDHETVERFFGCRVHGDAALNIVSFPRMLLDRRVKSANDLLFGLMGSYFGQIHMSAGKTFVDHIRLYARTTLATGNCTIERCAAKLDTSARTIQRRLTEQGLRFSEIVEEQRIEASKHALAHTADPLSDIAFNLGYADQSSFGRAFKRWTGLTPHAFRERSAKPQ